MDTLILSMSVLFLAAAGFVFARLGRIITGTTLIASWWWACAALGSLLMAALAAYPGITLEAGWRTAASYFAATMLLTPFVAALGARRPGFIAWQWFVVLPLVVVLNWPVVSQLVSSGGRAPIELGAPAVCGFLLVLVMAIGPYFGTRLTRTAIVAVIAILALLAPAAGWLELHPTIVMAAVLLAKSAEVRSWFVVQNHHDVIRNAITQCSRLDHIWQLFRDLYGFAWSSRVQDRINQFAPREQWTVTLTRDGFRRTDGQPVTDTDVEQPAVAFRWVLNRFVSDDWWTNVATPVDKSSAS